MALSEQQRQKKLLKKKQKRAAVVKQVITSMTMDKAVAYAKYPIHECLIPTNLFRSGLGEVIVARRVSNDKVAMGSFVIDVFCLGVKDALFKVFSEHEYEDIKSRFAEGTGRTFEKLHQTCAKKLVDGVVAYAKDLGFSPHPDYNNVKNIFGDIDASVCPVSYSYGKEGKPFYMNGPYESEAKIQKIIATLQKKCGEGGFGVVYRIGEDEDDDFF
ncbi:conserved hypothetical protein [Crenothrix polyspora]|uniref:Uncharacterized protein n=1 Tax=Crenothrix polyspora TaxID=360316 RepID=A0A1R4H1Z3_9GAMM|nr:hypothetical protein [Crenothrix polyspora]SJM90196.1 conserved hypothetical protein [Crenothrix polyspora]